MLLGNLWLAQRVGAGAGDGAGARASRSCVRYRALGRLAGAGGCCWAVSGFFGLVLGLGAAGWWEDWLLFANRQSFGVTDPVFSNDIGFYVFQVPFLRDLLRLGLPVRPW